MSYPDLGCFAECLECELCDDAPEDDLDLDFDWDDYDRVFGDDDGGDWDDWAPDDGDDDDGGWFDDWDYYPYAYPSGGGWRAGVRGRW